MNPAPMNSGILKSLSLAKEDSMPTTTAATTAIFARSSKRASSTPRGRPSAERPQGKTSTFAKTVYRRNCFIEVPHLRSAISGPECSKMRASSSYVARGEDRRPGVPQSLSHNVRKVRLADERHAEEHEDERRLHEDRHHHRPAGAESRVGGSPSRDPPRPRRTRPAQTG